MKRFLQLWAILAVWLFLVPWISLGIRWVQIWLFVQTEELWPLMMFGISAKGAAYAGLVLVLYRVLLGRLLDELL